MSETSLNIRPIKPNEHTRVLQLWEESVRASHDFITEKDIGHYRKMIAESLVNLKLFAVDEADQMQGFIALSDHKIQLLFVHPNAFRRGFGKRLIQYAVQEHRARLVDVNAQNGQAMSFYLSLGFRVYDKFPNDGAGKPYPVWSLRLKRNFNRKQRWNGWRKILFSLFRT
ncbi:GNAT family N-acetyltransferase [Pedobacter petrophilus]|uniref:GNAT family N-acetyltransferase n=1 Tax=Pedobacter petrophilus TaxID=1908241 RepID=A0A7K0FZF3_9SPHI|nr:GNAT family N-acetyltransferase [Pedobacter petrophilus]MRX76464.1 GNAT family N-acetyltransferase [Pedobacter petrophilus]